MYEVIVESKIYKDIKGIPKKDLQKIDKAIVELRNNPRPIGCKKLTEKEGYRIRIGHYRILYVIDDATKTVVVYRIRKKDKLTYK
jgi:mRNA interferase RelE/StbE